MTATHVVNSTVYPAPVLYRCSSWGGRPGLPPFTVGLGQKPRIRSIPARNLECLNEEILAAKKRFGLSASVQVVVSCYEAGRDGFWLDRYLDDAGIPKHHRRLFEHRGQPPAATGQIRSSHRRCQAGQHAGPMASRRAQDLAHHRHPQRRKRRTAANFTAS